MIPRIRTKRENLEREGQRTLRENGFRRGLRETRQSLFWISTGTTDRKLKDPINYSVLVPPKVGRRKIGISMSRSWRVVKGQEVDDL